MKQRSLRFLFLFLLSLSLSLSAQTTSKGSYRIAPETILRQEVRDIAAFDTAGFGEFQIAIRFPYGSARVLNPEAYAAIKSLGKISVEYVYTKYTASLPGQKELDRERFRALQRLAPDLFTDPGIRWDIIEQNAATGRKEAAGLFHGFVISYQPPITEERKKAIKDELELLVECARKRPPADAAQFPGGLDSLQAWLERNLKPPSEGFKALGSRSALLEFYIDSSTGMPQAIRVSKGISDKHNAQIQRTLETMPRWKAGNPKIFFSIVVQFSRDAGGKTSVQAGLLHGYDADACFRRTTDSTLTKVLARNKGWKKMLIVEDVTGSMMPYVGDLLLWNALKNNLQNMKHFIFFNDGDMKQDWEKVPGKTGGIYSVSPKNVDGLEEKMIDAMVHGNGGDTPENDIEAVLAGIKSCPDCEEVILIADNDATPRDLELLDKVTKPIHVILCGIDYSPNPAHLTIALKTKGSVHTISQDITELAKMQEGDMIVVMKQRYKVMNGKVVRTSRE